MFKSLLQNGRNLLTREHTSILSAAAVIMAAMFGSALLGVARNWVLIHYFYANPELVDVYWAAFRLPDMIFQLLVVGALSAAFIPVYSNLLAKNTKKANRTASSVINLVVLFLIVLSIITAIYAEPLSRSIAKGFTPSQISLMASLTRIMVLAQVLFGFSSFLTGIIQSHKRFLVPAIAPLLYNIGIIIGIVFLSEKMGIYGAAVGVVIGAFLHLISQIPLAFALGFKHSWKTWNHQDKNVRKVGSLMLPRTLALSVGQIEQTAIIYFASVLPAGNLTILSIAQQLAGVPIRLFGIPIGQASLPFFSKESTKNRLSKLAGLVNNSLLEIIYLSLPASMIVLVLRIPLVRLAYGSGSFPWAATLTTGKVVAILSFSIVARSLTHLLVRVFYALENTRTPLTIALISAVINLGLSYFFIFILKIGALGLASAITIASLIETALLVTILYAQAKFHVSNLLTPIAKMLFASFITFFSLWGPLRLLDQRIFDTTRTIPLIFLTSVVFLIGISIYLSLSNLLQIEQFKVFARLAKKFRTVQKTDLITEEPLESTESAI